MNLQGRPQLRLPAVVDRYPELAISCDQIGDYPDCHQRGFIQQLMETDTEIHSQTLGQVLEILLKRVKKEGL